MRAPILLTLLATSPLAAQLTTTYTGVQRDRGKDFPASAQFSVEDGRAAMIMKGSHSARMLFDAKAQVLHMVMDDDHAYFDITKSANPADPTGMLATMEKQMAQLPAAQQAMAKQMMQSVMAKQPAQLTYVWGTEPQTIAGYQCILVQGMRGPEKTTEYCGSTSDDFVMSKAERAAMLDLQGYLRNFTIMVQNGNDPARAFQWDTKTDGYPVLTRCFRDGEMTLELTLKSVDRKPLPASLFEIPSGYRKMDWSKGLP